MKMNGNLISCIINLLLWSTTLADITTSEKENFSTELNPTTTSKIISTETTTTTTTTTTTATTTTTNYLASDEEIIARTILREAFENGNLAYDAVAWVIYNRVKSGNYRNTAKEVCL